MNTNLLPDPGQRVRCSYGTRQQGVVCTLATGRHRQFLEVMSPTLDAYARRHQWAALISSEDLATGRPPSWSKLLLVRELLDEFEFVFWIDADAIIVDIARSVLDVVDAGSDIWFARHPQERNPDASVLNAGVFLARSCVFTRDLLQAVWASEDFIDHNWWENAALLDLLGYSLEPPYPQLRVTPWQSRIGDLGLDWNSVPGYCESDHPAVNHHARSDHDNFERRLVDLGADLRRTRLRFPTAFE